MYTIGEFARMAQVSRRQLRHWDEIGLLQPTKVDPKMRYTVVAVLMMMANANHAGVPALGYHPKVSRAGRNVGIVFTPFWVVVAILNGLAFVNSLG